jgi:hypothetical protein
MRALSADDPIAPESDRPDHGAGGAFCAWPGLTAHGLACLGRPDLALELLRATPGAASGGLWGQAVELVTDGEGSVVGRVAERGVSNRDSIAGAATSEAVLSGLFDFNPTFGRLGAERAVELNRHSSVPGLGMLRNLNTSMS